MRSIVQWSGYIILLSSYFAGLLLFAKGFFPSKVVLPGDGFYFDDQQFEPQFDKMILMVVDAMRSDFIFSNDSSMSFVHQLINNGNALGFTAHSTPPTVTLPRLKGITTGSTPNFLDAILNVAEEDTSSTLGEQDSWVKQLHKQGRKIHMFGDDTWIKLFPNMFEKYDGTNSFFVSDFTDVDNNVTRHINDELANSDWDCLILHYLGLDHIGHKGGPSSVFMKPKQKEMDGIIERLYKYTEESNTLLVVMGDHGMNEIGNHGGSSQGETSAGLLFASPKFKSIKQKNIEAPLVNNDAYTFYKRIQQVDIVPTLAGLLNFPIPKNNLGLFVSDFLPLWETFKEQQQILLQNCKQLKSLIEASFGLELGMSISESSKNPDHESLNFKWMTVLNATDQNELLDSSYKFLRESQSHLAQAATNYNYDDMYLGFAALVGSCIICSIIFITYFSGELISNTIFFGFALLYSLSFHGSSLIEEEYQIWWWLATVLLLVFFYSNKSFITTKKISFLVVLVSLRLIRSFNNSGQKFVSVSLSEVLQERYEILWLLNSVTYILYATLICTGGFSLVNPSLAFIGSFVVASMSFSFKICQTIANGNKLPNLLVKIAAWIIVSLGADNAQDSLIPLALLTYKLIIGMYLTRIILSLYNFNSTTPLNRKYRFFSDLSNITTLLLINQTSYFNIPMFLLFFIIRNRFNKLIFDFLKETKNLNTAVLVIAIFTLVLQHLSFFSFGNTNSLASVDLSNAYNGVSSYNLILVGILTFVSNFAAPIYWAVSSFSLLFENGLTVGYLKNQILWLKSLCLLTFYSISAVSLIGSCINLRFHLFIWTVFCPKLLYFYSWSILMNGLIDMLYIAISFIY